MTVTESPTELPNDARVSLTTDRVHVLLVPALQSVALRLLDFERQPLAEVDCHLRIAGRELLGRTDPEGKIVFRVTASAVEAEGIVHPDTDAHGWASGRPITVTTVPPAQTPRGQRIRLDNLGYVAAGWDAPPDDETPSVWAIEEFQCEHDLVVDGECGPTTQAKLVEVHGH